MSDKKLIFKGLCGEELVLLSRDPFVPDKIVIPECRIEADQTIADAEGAVKACKACEKRLPEVPADTPAPAAKKRTKPAAEEKPKPLDRLRAFGDATKIVEILLPFSTALQLRILSWVSDTLLDTDS